MCTATSRNGPVNDVYMPIHGVGYVGLLSNHSGLSLFANVQLILMAYLIS